jgi:hypothetical protein
VLSGLARERKSGRERVMEITDLGRNELESHREEKSRAASARLPPEPRLSSALESDRVHHRDRPRFHLRHAALLALWKLRRRHARLSADDWRYDQMLLALATESGDDATNFAADQEVLGSLRSRWSTRDRRRLLVEALVKFQDVRLRRQTGAELVALGDKIEESADAVLWSSAAIELAHHYSFAAASQVDRLTARRLLSQAKQLLLKARTDPELQVAADYRLAKAAKVASVGWTGVSGAPKLVAPELEVEADAELALLAGSLNELNAKVSRADSFNRVLEKLDRALSRHVGRWVMQAFPSTEWIFRRAGGTGIAAEIRDWAVEMRDRGTLNDLLVSQVNESPEFRSELTQFIANAEPYRRDFETVVEPHVLQAKALLGQPAKAAPVEYDAMLMNNLWNPEMVAAHAIAQPGESKS